MRAEGREHGHKTGRGPFSWALSIGHSRAISHNCQDGTRFEAFGKCSCGLVECRAAYSVKPAREDASAGLRILAMLPLERAGEEGSATPPSDPSCLVPNTKGLPHLQGGETIAGFEDPSGRAIIPPLGQRLVVDRLPSRAERLKVCKSVALRRHNEVCCAV